MMPIEAQVLLGGPLLGGLLLRLVPRAFQPERRRVVLAATVLLVLAAPFVVAPWASPSIYDLIFSSWLVELTLLGPSLLPTATRLRWFTAGILTVCLFVGAASLETLARQLPSPPQSRGPVSGPALYPMRDARCATLFETGTVPARPQVPGVRRVIHLGDSLVFGEGVPEAANFVSLLKRARRNEEHLNYGLSNTGPDFYLARLRREAVGLNADDVIVYLFLGNDAWDIDGSYLCCADGPLLGAIEDGLPSNCPRPTWRHSLRYRLAVEPAPYLVRLLATRSEAANRLEAILERTARGLAWTTNELAGTPAQQARLGAILVALRDQVKSMHARLTLVLLPPRWSLVHPKPDDPFQALHRLVVKDANDAGIRTFDAWDLVQSALTGDPNEDWFVGTNDRDPHFGLAGHRLMAQWLSSTVLQPDP
jgi:hypothetical protein